MPLALKLVLLGTVTTAAVFDLRYRRIPNWLNLSAAVFGVAANLLLFRSHGLTMALLGILCSLVVYVPLYLLRGMGAGDVKLMAAIGAIVGPINWLWIFLLTALLGGVVSVLYVAARGRLRQTLWNLLTLVQELLRARLPAVREPRLDVCHRDALRMPHGALIALGAVVFLAIGSRAIISAI